MNIRRIIGLSILFPIAGLAQAHTHLASSEPADGSVVTAAPANFVAHFSEATRVTALALSRDGGKEEKIAVPASTTQQLSVALPRLEPGKYVLTWRAVGNDSHVASGKVEFTYDPNGKPTKGNPADHAHSH